MSDRDISAISTWEHGEDDPGRVGHSDGPTTTYVCVTPGCGWKGKACQSAEHHHEHPAHRIRIKNCPESWPDCQWPTAHDWRDDEAERATFEAQAERDGWTQVQPDLLRAEVK